MSFDIVWTEHFKWREKPLGYYRLLKARKKYGTRIRAANPFTTGHLFRREPGYQEKLRRLRNLHEGRRCFILGNGPSLNRMDLSYLRDEITIGSNGIYRLFPKIGFSTTYFTMEDISQCEDRRSELHKIKEPIKIFALHNAYCVVPDDRTLFMNVYLHQDGEQKFSTDCSAVVYLGSTITYINLQLAFHMGCNPVYLVGVDFNYGQIERKLDPGKVIITPDVIVDISQAHFDPHYHKVGGRFGVPHTEKQYAAFQKAREVYEENGRKIFNAGLDSKLDIFEKVDYLSLFSDEPDNSQQCRMSPNDELVIMLGSPNKGEKWKRLYDKAALCATNGRRRKALELLRRSLSVKPNIPAYYLAGFISMQLGDMDYASALFENVLENPGLRHDRSIYGGSHLYLGEINYRQRNLIEAKFHFEKCLSLVPSCRKAAEYLERINLECKTESLIVDSVEITAP